MSVSVSVFLLMSVTVDQCFCSRGHVSVHDRIRVHDRDRVRDRVRYILSVSIVVPVTSSARGWGRDHRFECVTVRMCVLRGCVHA